MSRIRIGIDVGGTNTDAVAIAEDGKVLAWKKTVTTENVAAGIYQALDGVLSGFDPKDVVQVMLGTTHPINAIIRRRGLARVGILRIGAPATLAIPPLTGWPRDLASQLQGVSEIIHGGHDWDGSELGPLDEDAIVRFAKACSVDVDAIAIVSANSPTNSDHEVRAGMIVEQSLDSALPLTLSHEIGGFGILGRENSALLNAALTIVGRSIIDGLAEACRAHNLDVDLYLTQNDGTLLGSEDAGRRPIMTVGSGPTNSMRGAAYLSGLSDAIVMDVGGTSLDVGLLVDGFPRESALPNEIGGVRTNFRMPDLISVGIGGGSLVHVSPKLTIGPDSVGARLLNEALVFGGETLTLTDISTLSGRAMIGDRDKASRVMPGVVRQSLAWIDSQFAELAYRIKSGRDDMPLIAVGGGSHLVPDVVPGATEVIRNGHSHVANAIGAAIAEASGSVDRLFNYDVASRDRCIAGAKESATDAAIVAGADPTKVRITAVTEIPMTYMPSNISRLRVKAVGPLLSR